MHIFNSTGFYSPNKKLTVIATYIILSLARSLGVCVCVVDYFFFASFVRIYFMSKLEQHSSCFILVIYTQHFQNANTKPNFLTRRDEKTAHTHTSTGTHIHSGAHRMQLWTNFICSVFHFTCDRELILLFNFLRFYFWGVWFDVVQLTGKNAILINTVIDITWVTCVEISLKILCLSSLVRLFFFAQLENPNIIPLSLWCVWKILFNWNNIAVYVYV